MLAKYIGAFSDWVPFLQNNFPQTKIFTFFKTLLITTSCINIVLRNQQQKSYIKNHMLL